MIVETVKASHSNGLGDVAEWLRSGLQIRAKTPQKQRSQRETIPPNNREHPMNLGNRFSDQRVTERVCARFAPDHMRDEAATLDFAAPKLTAGGRYDENTKRPNDSR
jgi:hypothetical protein